MRETLRTTFGEDAELYDRHRPGYPPALGEIPDPPSLLYVRGSIEPADQLAIALVGSRKCTPYGLRIAERLATSLARVGLTVVSGLAAGIRGNLRLVVHGETPLYRSYNTERPFVQQMFYGPIAIGGSAHRFQFVDHP